MSTIKIFVIYHKDAHVFRNGIFEPIQTGADFSGIDLGFLKDNTGENIAIKNKNYGELTAWYWVWKNWLPEHPEITHIGFNHYRRFLDILEPLRIFEKSRRICSSEEFVKRFGSLNFREDALSKEISKYDIILPTKFDTMSFEGNFGAGNLYEQYVGSHPEYDFIKAAEVYLRTGSYERLSSFWNGSSFYTCLNFVLRRDLFEMMCSWMFQFLNLLEMECDWRGYQSYNEIRSAAFLVERYFSLWVEGAIQDMNLHLKICPRWLLDEPHKRYDWPWYLSGIKQWSLWKIGRRKLKPFQVTGCNS